MNCETLHRQLLALERPDAPPPELGSHLAVCAACLPADPLSGDHAESPHSKLQVIGAVRGQQRVLFADLSRLQQRVERLIEGLHAVRGAGHHGALQVLDGAFLQQLPHPGRAEQDFLVEGPGVPTTGSFQPPSARHTPLFPPTCRSMILPLGVKSVSKHTTRKNFAGIGSAAGDY